MKAKESKNLKSLITLEEQITQTKEEQVFGLKFKWEILNTS